MELPQAGTRDKADALWKGVNGLVYQGENALHWHWSCLGMVGNEF
jgi:hypothetical protein